MIAEQPAASPATPPANDVPSPIFLTVSEVAERLTLHPQMVYRLIEQKRIGIVRLGAVKGIRITAEQLNEFIARNTQPAKSKRK